MAMKGMTFTVFSYYATVLLIQPNPTQPINGHNPCPSLCHRRRGVALSDTAICPSVCPSLGYRHAGCLQLAGHQRCADCGPVRGRMQIRRESSCHWWGDISSRRPRGDNLYYDTIRDAVLTCAKKLTQISLIYRTEKWRKRKTKNGYAQKYRLTVRVCCCGPMLRQTDGRRNKPTNVIHRLCSACYAGSANKTMKILSRYVVTLYTDICCSLDCDAVLLSVCRCHFQSKNF